MASQRLYASTALSWEKAAHVKETDIAGRKRGHSRVKVIGSRNGRKTDALKPVTALPRDRMPSRGGLLFITIDDMDTGALLRKFSRDQAGQNRLADTTLQIGNGKRQPGCVVVRWVPTSVHMMGFRAIAN